MSTKMNRLQKLIEDDQIVRREFTRFDIPERAYEMINYVMLPFDDINFNSMIANMTIDRDRGRRVVSEGVRSVRHDRSDNPIAVDLMYIGSPDLRMMVNTTIYNFRFHGFRARLLPSHMNIRISTFTAMKIRSGLYTAFDNIFAYIDPFDLLSPQTHHHFENWLGMLNFDLQEGITQPLRYYIKESAKHISEFIQICNDNNWNEMVMIILRICHEEGLHSTDTGIYRL